MKEHIYMTFPQTWDLIKKVWKSKPCFHDSAVRGGDIIYWIGSVQIWAYPCTIPPFPNGFAKLSLIHFQLLIFGLMWMCFRAFYFESYSPVKKWIWCHFYNTYFSLRGCATGQLLGRHWFREHIHFSDHVIFLLWESVLVGQLSIMFQV